MRSDKLKKAQKLKNDEFYTLYDDVKKIFFEFRNYVKGKKYIYHLIVINQIL